MFWFGGHCRSDKPERAVGSCEKCVRGLFWALVVIVTPSVALNLDFTGEPRECGVFSLFSGLRKRGMPDLWGDSLETWRDASG